jgi:hypothetical protein
MYAATKQKHDSSKKNPSEAFFVLKSPIQKIPIQNATQNLQKCPSIVYKYLLYLLCLQD